MKSDSLAREYGRGILDHPLIHPIGYMYDHVMVVWLR